MCECVCLAMCVSVYVCLFILEEQQGEVVVFPNSQQILIFGMHKQEIRTARSSPNFKLFLKYFQPSSYYLLIIMLSEALV